MTSKNPAYKVRSSKGRHEAIAELAKKRGFKSVAGYIQSLIDKDAADADFDIPESSIEWGGKR